MSQLDRFLDDALAGFDDEDEGFQHVNSPANSVPVSVSSPAATSSGVAPPPALAYALQQSSSSSSSSRHEQAGASQPSSSAAPAAAGSQAKGLPSLQFDPLKRKKKAKPAAAGAAADAAAAFGAGSSDAARPALTPQVQQLQEDLAKLVSEWSQAMHPEADAGEPAAAAVAAGNQQRSGMSVLAALAEQTQRTVEQQSRMRPPPAGPAAAAAATAAAAGGGGGEMNAIVDVVMQHLLSKDVLYQPMKEIMEKYPPWLDRQATAAGSSSSSRLSAEELERYKAQYDCITRLVAAYESEPDNTAKIMQLLQEMQACGEPPAEIVQEMSSAIAADLPPGVGGDDAEGGNPAAGMNFDGLDFGDVDLEALPQELKNCPVQ